MEEPIKKEPIRISFKTTLIILSVVSCLVLGSVFYLANQVDDFSDYKINVKPEK